MSHAATNGNTSYSEILPGLFIGGISSVAYLPIDHGTIDWIIVCARELVAIASETPNGFVDMVHCPLRDNDEIETDLVERTVERCVEQINAGKTMLICCAEGRNRSGLIMALVLNRLGYDNPVEMLRSIRHSNVLSNHTFEQYVLTRGG